MTTLNSHCISHVPASIPYSQPSVLSSVEVLDPISGAWSYAAPLPIQRAGACMVVVNNALYIIGGTTGAGRGILNIIYPHAQNNIADVSKLVAGGNWTSGGNQMHTGRSGHACGVQYESVIYATGGWVWQNGAVTTNTAEEYTPSS